MIGKHYLWRGARWVVWARGKPFDRGPRRNVLIERLEPLYPDRPEHGSWVQTGDFVIRPFRGLRCA